MRKFIILFLIVAVIAMFGLPTALSANDDPYIEYYITVTKTSTGFDSGDFTFDLWVWDLVDEEYELLSSKTIGYGGDSIIFNFGSTDPQPKLVYIVESGTNGATGVQYDVNSPPTATDGIINDTVFFGLTSSTKTIYFDNIKLTHSETKAEPVWVRTMPMTCWQVWINEDNDFQFIFWYPYKDNNWVRIYDMEGNIVFETDLPINNPNLTVDLPDGFYMVKTFHHDTPIQEFLIGKP